MKIMTTTDAKQNICKKQTQDLNQLDSRHYTSGQTMTKKIRTHLSKG